MSDLYHTLETTVESDDVTRVMQLGNLCISFSIKHPGSNIGINLDCSYVRINARCNGAALYALVGVLNQLEVLD